MAFKIPEYLLSTQAMKVSEHTVYVFSDNIECETDSEVVKFQIQMQISLAPPNHKLNSSFPILSSGQKRERPATA